MFLKTMEIVSEPLRLLLVLALLGRATHAAVYSVGPSELFKTIAEVLSGDLQAGDLVLIHPGQIYHEKFVINNAGTAAAPIIIRGVPDSDGNLPILDGNGAQTPLSQDYWNERRSLIKIGGANAPNEGAAYVRIENLQLQNAHESYSFQDDSGNTQNYFGNAACIHIEQGSHIEIVNNIISGCGNGIFVTPGVEDVLIQGNYIYGNGNVNSIYEHNTYTEALGITYSYNRFGPLCSGCKGNNLKDRSGGLVVAYNLIHGGNRQLDLVDADDANILTDSRYRTTFVYGNILFENEDGNRQIVHYGGDSGTESKYRQGTLHFYHNTVVSTREGRTTLLRLSSEKETCDARNNIVYVTASGNQLELLSERRGKLVARSNWIKTNYVHSFELLGSGSVTEYDTITGNVPGFHDAAYLSSFDVRLSNSLLPSAVLATAVPAVDREYVLHTRSRLRIGSDIGAYGYETNASPTPPITPVPTPQPSATPATPTSPVGGQQPTSTSNARPTWCFSATNTIEVRGVGDISMDALRVGDFVRASNNDFSRVFSFGHRDQTSRVEYLKIRAHGLKQNLEITPEHMVFLENGPVRADEVKIGDHLNGLFEVSEIRTVHRRGAYAPITESGSIVVSGVLASSYVAPLAFMPSLQHAMAHGLFAPHRLLCRYYWDFCDNESYTENGLAVFTTYPLLIVTSWLCKQSFLVQRLAALAAIPLILALFLVELLLRPSSFISILLWCGIPTIWLRAIRAHKQSFRERKTAYR